MKIIGIDPGLQKTGWGVIEAENGHLRHLAHGVIKTRADEDIAVRLVSIFDELINILKAWNIAEAAIEETFVNRNPASALKLGLARGAAMLAPAKVGMRVAEYPANLVKKSLVGNGHAEKEQMQMMIKLLLQGIEAPSDAADALAVAICHAHHRATRQRLGGIMAGAAR